jgi:phosphate-selective porin OprO/OprP
MAQLLALLLLLAPDKPADLSLENEVGRYLAGAEGGAPDPSTLRAFWKDGLRLEAADGAVKFRIGGRLQLDAFFKDADDELTADFGAFEDGVAFRRVRLVAAGTMYRNFEVSLDLEFAKGSDVELRYTYVGLREIPLVGNVRVGHMKEPFALDEQTSSMTITFMERSVAETAFVPVFNTGILAFRSFAGGRATGALGLFKATNEVGGAAEADGQHAVTARVTALPFRDTERLRLLHLGVAASLRDPEGERARFRARPGVSSGPRVVDTGDIPVDDVFLLGLELAGVAGPLCVQAEMFFAEAGGATDRSFLGWYVEASYWITGETRPYDAALGRFDRVRPRRGLHEGGVGAWQAAARFSALDLDDGPIAGGKMTETVVGVNWHPNPNARVMLNVVFADVERSGRLAVLQIRFQADF